MNCVSVMQYLVAGYAIQFIDGHKYRFWFDDYLTDVKWPEPIEAVFHYVWNTVTAEFISANELKVTWPDYGFINQGDITFHVRDVTANEGAVVWIPGDPDAGIYDSAAMLYYNMGDAPWWTGPENGKVSGWVTSCVLEGNFIDGHAYVISVRFVTNGYDYKTIGWWGGEYLNTAPITYEWHGSGSGSGTSIIKSFVFE
jgi:hypothetical protein